MNKKFIYIGVLISILNANNIKKDSDSKFYEKIIKNDYKIKNMGNLNKFYKKINNLIKISLSGKRNKDIIIEKMKLIKTNNKYKGKLIINKIIQNKKEDLKRYKKFNKKDAEEILKILAKNVSYKTAINSCNKNINNTILYTFLNNKGIIVENIHYKDSNVSTTTKIDINTCKNMKNYVNLGEWLYKRKENQEYIKIMKKYY